MEPAIFNEPVTPNALQRLLDNPLALIANTHRPREAEPVKTANQKSSWTLAQKALRNAKNKKARAARRNNR